MLKLRPNKESVDGDGPYDQQKTNWGSIDLLYPFLCLVFFVWGLTAICDRPWILADGLFHIMNKILPSLLVM